MTTTYVIQVIILSSSRHLWKEKYSFTLYNESNHNHLQASFVINTLIQTRSISSTKNTFNMNARRRLLVRDPKKMISPMMSPGQSGRRAVFAKKSSCLFWKKSSCFFWALFAMACTTAIVSIIYSYDGSNRPLSVQDESDFLSDFSIEKSSSFAGTKETPPQLLLTPAPRVKDEDIDRPSNIAVAVTNTAVASTPTAETPSEAGQEKDSPGGMWNQGSNPCSSAHSLSKFLQAHDQTTFSKTNPICPSAAYNHIHIAIPFYNLDTSTLKNAIQSIQQQEYPSDRVTIWVYDDASDLPTSMATLQQVCHSEILDFQPPIEKRWYDDEYIADQIKTKNVYTTMMCVRSVQHLGPGGGKYWLFRLV